MQNYKKSKENIVKIGAFLRNYATRLAFACAIVAFVLFVPASLTASVGLRVFLIVLIALLLVSGGALLFYANLGHHGQVHYFLYDRRRNRLYRREELTDEIVEDAMAHYLRDFVENEGDLWRQFPKHLRVQLEAQLQFRPLVMYRMLSFLSKQEPAQALAIFEAADESLVTYLCRSISKGGDREMADYIYHLKKNVHDEKERISLFFQKNKRVFSARMLRYIDLHFEEFYVPKQRLEK